MELKHLDLSFFVNNNNPLESRELGLEIDQNQGIQTLREFAIQHTPVPIPPIYRITCSQPIHLLISLLPDGFLSMIVLREVNNHQRRSIITPNGQLESRRLGMHTEVRAGNSNNYYRFSVDRVLGRFSCASEPRLLLFKAHLHALTSFVLPDGLTGRTGTEEAFATLASGQCQPWQPLDSKSISILQGLADLCQTREYYPKDKKNLQGVVWKPNLSPHAQHDCFYNAVYNILSKSKQLREFSCQDPGSQVGLPYRETHLGKRGEVQATRYARVNDITQYLEKRRNDIYEPRDRVRSSRAVNAHKIASICWGSQIRVDVSPIKSTMTA